MPVPPQLGAPGTMLPLRRGDKGDPVADLQARLRALGLAGDDPTGVFGPSTEACVRAFQERRGLTPTGVCDNHTWSAVVEAGYRLGDRPLYRHVPMLRGDDVAELQRRLSALGFDTGRIDGIFGDQTAAALRDFQRNAGLTIDGICGRATLIELQRVSSPHGDSSLVTPLRERYQLSAAGLCGLRGRRIGIAGAGGFATGAGALSRALRAVGAEPLVFYQPDPSLQAEEANAARADCVLSFRLDPDAHSCFTAYYSGFRSESVVSRHLAERIQAELPAVIGLEDGGIRGMALPILRETRMPAVELCLGAPAVVAQRLAELASVVVRALAAWLEAEAT
jgi:N-acetylmuramoyl-L-alanine amidase